MVAGKCASRAKQDVFGAAGQVGLVLFGERRDRKGVPAESVGIAIVASQACRRQSQSKQMQLETTISARFQSGAS